MNTTTLSENEASLLRRFVRARDADAFSEITRLYAGMVYGTCLRITGNHEHAADAAQETFYHLLKHAGRISGSLGGWLHQVAVRRAIDLVRRDVVRRRHESAFAAVADPIETDQWGDVSPLVDQALSELEEESRDVLLRRYLQGQSTVQIAATKGLSQPTISRRVEQALEELRGKLRAKGVLLSAAILLGLMPNATTSAPAEMLAELGKMALTTGGSAAGGLATAVFSGLGLKVSVPALLALVGVGGFLIFQHYQTLRWPARGKVAQPASRPAEVRMNSTASSPEDISGKAFDLLLNQHNPVSAKALFEACIREFPDYADAYHGLALAQRDSGGDPAESLRNHDRAIELAPQRADYYWWQSETYKGLKNHDAAIKVLERGLTAKDTKQCQPGLLQVSLAQSYRATGNFAKALAYNEQALALDPQNKWYYRERGWTYQAMGDQERAEADLAMGGESQTRTKAR